MTSQKTIMAIYPHAGGFGYVCMESPRNLLDFGSLRVRPLCNKKVMKRLVSSIEYLRPVVILLQDPSCLHTRTGKRNQQLFETIIDFCERNTIEHFQYTREQIRCVFSEFNAHNKYEIATYLLSEFTELEHKRPKKPKLWEREHWHMPIFDALSLAITYYYFNE